jgi:Flp pilus assembly protein TadB
MNVSVEWALIGLLLAASMIGLFWKLGAERRAVELLQKTKAGMDESGRRHLLQERQKLLDVTRHNTLWQRMNRELEYSGLKRQFPFLTVERGLALLAAALSAGLVGCWVLFSLPVGILVAAGELLILFLRIEIGKLKNLRAVNEDLMKFLDFLGNYSYSSGELTSILGSVSPYLNEPLRSVLEECEMEGRLTGNVSLAVLGMAEKIQHPMFRQLVRNMEITSRYSADFLPLVMDSRRSMREYLQQSRERKGMLREAAINMFLLLIMSAVMLLIVGGLVGKSLSEILLGTMAGHIGLGVLAVICFLFLRQIVRLNQ